MSNNKKNSKYKHLTHAKLFLASESPRRSQLLEALKIPFEKISPVATETHPPRKGVGTVAIENALAKAKSISKKMPREGIAIGADTVVVLQKEVLGKPKSAKDVKRYLIELSGKTHRVVTGLALYSKAYGTRTSHTISKVTFRPISMKEMEAYSRIQEPYDKAGAYAVQGMGALFIKKIEGSYTNVMGLPVETFMKDLVKLTDTPIQMFFEPHDTREE